LRAWVYVVAVSVTDAFSDMDRNAVRYLRSRPMSTGTGCSNER
jgi:hypothetical protein